MESLRSIDHLVLPVPDLQTARRRLTSLGFVVANDARHPFGTENACVFLGDGTYLEPLAVHDAGLCEEAVKAGNMFVARDQAFRFRVGENGLSAIVLKSDNAVADDALFQGAGFGGGPMLSFSRPVRQPDGTENTASFHLAFAADLRAPEFFFFACQRLNAPGFPRAPDHPNGVSGLKAVVLSEERPTDFKSFLHLMAGDQAPAENVDGLHAVTANSDVRVLTPAAIEATFGIKPPRRGRGLFGEGLVFSAASLAAVEKCLVDSKVEYVRNAGRIVVPPAPGQGVFAAFEEQE